MLGLDAAKGIIERYAATLAAMDDDPAAEILVGFLTYFSERKRSRVVIKALASFLPAGQRSKDDVMQHLWRSGVPD